MGDAVKWRRKSDGLETDDWGCLLYKISSRHILRRILPHLPMAAQKAALGDGWEVVETDAAQAPQTAPVAQEPTPKPVSGWQPIETAPRDGRWVLVWGTSIGHPYITTGASAHLSGTHWQPLPGPPAR